MGRRKQFRPKKAENSNDSEDGGGVGIEDHIKSSNNGGHSFSPSMTLTPTNTSPPPNNPPLISLPPHHPNPTATLGILSPWLSELKGPEGMAARLLQLQRLALQYNNSNGKSSSQMDPLDLSSKLPFPWNLPAPPPPPQPLWNPGWFLNSSSSASKLGPHLRSSHLKSQQQQQTSPLGKETSSPSPVGGGNGPVKDIFRCVWCTESYSTLDELTHHLVEAKHNTSNLPRCESPIVSKASLPRKLVRGQDVWLGKGQEQTREILKCMWCGQSFKSLADLTLHMQETKHYTKVISQEQITSWKQQQGDPTSNNTRGAPSPPKPPLNSPPVSNNNNSGSNTTSSAHNNSNNPNVGGSQCPNSSVNGVGGLAEILTCKVCDEPCSSLKELTSHMARNNHYKSEPRVPSKRLRDSSSPPPTLVLKEKRKKSLPVRKLLELERIKSDPISSSPTSSTTSSSSNSCSPPKKSRLPHSEEDNNSGSILGSLEQMVETSFKSTGGGCINNKKGSSGMVGSSGGLLSRLGIDEEKSEDESVHFLSSSKGYPKFLSSFLNNNNHHNTNNNNMINSLRSNSSASLEESLLSYKKIHHFNDERLSSSSSSSSPLPLRCSLCSDEFGDKENFADHFERKHANFMLNSLAAKGGAAAGSFLSFDSSHNLPPHPPVSAYNSTTPTSINSNNNNSGSNAGSVAVNEESSESKFLKYSELAKQLSGR